jgi:nucleoid-associated protein YgaU
VPVAVNEIPPRAGYSATPPANATYPAGPTYRDSVYREPGAVSGVGSAPIASSAKAPAASATAPAAADPYATHSPVPAAAPYETPARNASVTTGSLPHAVSEKQAVSQRENTGKYYVEPGDSFWIISKKVYGTGGFFKALQEHNRARILTPSDLQVGDELLTPSVAELRDLYSGLCPKERIAKPGSPAATQAAHTSVSHAGDVRHYEVQDGDTLFDIARYELGDAKRWPEIYQLNRVAIGQDIDHVKPGTKLVLPLDAPLEAAPEEGYRGDILTRKPGDIR